MSIAKLILDEFKPWASIRVCNLTVDCNTNINGFSPNTGYYSAIGTSGSDTEQIPNLDFTYRPILATNTAIIEESNNFTVTKVNNTIVVTYTGAQNIYVNITARIFIYNSEEIGLGLKLYKNGQPVARSGFNTLLFTKSLVPDVNPHAADMFVGNLPIVTGDEFVMYMASIPFLLEPLGDVSLRSYNLYVTAN